MLPRYEFGEITFLQPFHYKRYKRYICVVFVYSAVAAGKGETDLIIINVLPPEYRRRDIGVNPITLSIAGAAFVNVIILLLWAYIQLVSIPHALDVKDVAAADRAEWKAKAEKVKEIDKDIVKAERRFGELITLLNKKVYWAKTLSEFVTVLSTDERLNTDAFQVSIDSLEIKEVRSSGRTPRGKKKKKAQPARIFNFDWTARIVGLDRETLGAHPHTMFTVFETSDFWGRLTAKKFMDQPDTSYDNFKIQVNEKIGKAVTSVKMQWKRISIPEDPKVLLAKARGKKAKTQKGAK